MKTTNTFTGAGWDFVGEITNGTEDIWAICEGTNYPRLVWQIPCGDFVCPDGVDFRDFGTVASAWQSEPNEPDWKPACDISQPQDSVIASRDLVTFCENWLTDAK